MAEDSLIPYTTDEGINYLIKFTVFSPEKLPEEINLPVIDIVIETDSAVHDINNDSKVLIQITKIISDYLKEEEAILYYYCSDREIKKSKRNKHLSHQEFRSKLFSAMFSLNKATDLINKLIVIDDPSRNNHYLHLIGDKKHESVINRIADEAKKLDK